MSGSCWTPQAMSYQQRFNARYYEPGRLTWAHRHLPERVRMWSPFWLRHVVAVERTLHQRTMDELRANTWQRLRVFLTAKRLPRTTRVVGGFRRAYLNPDRVRVVHGHKREDTK